MGKREEARFSLSSCSLVVGVSVRGGVGVRRKVVHRDMTPQDGPGAQPVLRFLLCETTKTSRNLNQAAFSWGF